MNHFDNYIKIKINITQRGQTSNRTNMLKVQIALHQSYDNVK